MRVDLLIAVQGGVSRQYKVVLDDVVEKAQAAERAGIESVWLGEHHFTRSAKDLVPNPIMLLTQVAAHTESVRLGVGSISLPLWHPVRAAEDVSVLDHLSGGRVDCGLSRSISQLDIMTLNPDGDRRVPERSFALWEESVVLFRKSIGGRPFRHDGHFYTVPGDVAGAAPDAEVEVAPHPLQADVPLYSVTESEQGVRHAAQERMRVVTWYPTLDKLTRLIEVYADEHRRVHGEEIDAADHFGLLRPFFVAPTDDEARELAEPSVTAMVEGLNALRKANVWSGTDDEEDGRHTMRPYDYLISQEQLLVGSPETVLGQIEAIAARSGIRHFMAWGNLDVGHDHHLRSLSLFGSDVMPKLAGASLGA